MQYAVDTIKEIVPSHSHKNYEIIVFTEGNGTLHTPFTDIDVLPGKTVIIPPGVQHYTTTPCGKIERIFINGDFNRVFHLTTPLPITDTDEGFLLAKMIYKNRFAVPEYLDSLVNAFTHCLLQNIKMEDELYTAVNAVVDKISTDFSDSRLNLSAILKKTGYAEDYIRDRFKKIMGKTPTEFLTALRIRHACYLIDTYKNAFALCDVAEKCGYTDYVYFSRRFKKIMGISPRKYKESI